ncbi:hypothetical protein CYMTET_29749 [Cymbomonas tetramitiformis]|uniref:MRH domain-containing protein n=1 Tax=Cymbomonas tetramitiformis TaxID=36881 RepID=A0AAE0FKE6_9CHLO|nr:hypothetical protein CYMTET_29749 [Cymbomonas tetramitiformis]
MASWHFAFRARDGEGAQAGPYDPPNTYFNYECADVLANEGWECHNRLKATLTFLVKLVRPGFVKYRYTVDSEKGYDGLLFYVDSAEAPVKSMDSYEFAQKEVIVPLTAGYHSFWWVYQKDSGWTAGQDVATIDFLEVNGTTANDVFCLPCPAGFASEEGSSECTPCPVDHFRNASMATCDPCPSGTYSLNLPRSECTPRPACDLGLHANSFYGPCQPSDNMDGTRMRYYEWLQPKICANTSALPEPLPEACPPCSAGTFRPSQQAMQEGGAMCEPCPEGTISTEGNACEECPAGTIAPHKMIYEDFSRYDDVLPEDLSTGCNGDCGSAGWRINNKELDSGVGHGRYVDVWLQMNVTLAMAGGVRFNYGVSSPAHDATRSFLFFIDDTIKLGSWHDSDAVIRNVSHRTSDVYELSKGPHVLTWVYKKSGAVQTPDQLEGVSDQAMIYRVQVSGTTSGGAMECAMVPPGYMARSSRSSYEMCPSGTYSFGNTSVCLPCPANTYGASPGAGSEESCTPCGQGTSSKAGSKECSIGDVDDKASFCTFALPKSDAAATGAADAAATTPATHYSLRPLEALHPMKMFGPVHDNASVAGEDPTGHRYWVNVCSRNHSNATCDDAYGNPVQSYICQESMQLSSRTDRRIGVALGDTVSIQSIEGMGPERGFQMVYLGKPCVSSERKTILTFVCSPDSGIGEPEAWTEENKAVVFDSNATFPWMSEEGRTALPVEAGHCEYDLVWYSLFACPLCTEDNFEAVQVEGCQDNKRVMHRWKVPSLPSSPFALFASRSPLLGGV